MRGVSCGGIGFACWLALSAVSCDGGSGRSDLSAGDADRSDGRDLGEEGGPATDGVSPGMDAPPQVRDADGLGIADATTVVPGDAGPNGTSDASTVADGPRPPDSGLIPPVSPDR